MSKGLKTKEIVITDDKGTFSTFFKKIAGEKADFDFEGLATVRSILSNEKARILHIIKHKSPESLYALAKLTGRDFKSVNDDVRALEKFGFIDLIKERKKNRNCLKPVIIIDTIKIEIKV